MLKTAVLAPMPSASVRMATRVKPGLLRSERKREAEIVHQSDHGGSPGALARARAAMRAAFAFDGIEIAERLERRQPGRLGPHAGVDQLLGAHVEMEAQLAADVAGDVGGGAGEAEEAAHGPAAQAGAASSAALTARA